jgi:hypothetical protein
MQFGMVTQLAAIVSEKEQGLVTALRHMGLLQSSYWSSWVLFDLLMGLLTALSIVICGEFEDQLPTVMNGSSCREHRELLPVYLIH